MIERLQGNGHRRSDGQSSGSGTATFVYQMGSLVFSEIEEVIFDKLWVEFEE